MPRVGRVLTPRIVISLNCRCADGSPVTLFDDGVVAGAMAGMMIAPPADPRCRGVPAGVWPIPTAAAEPSRPDRHLPLPQRNIDIDRVMAHRDHHRGLSASERPRVDGAKMHAGPLAQVFIGSLTPPTTRNQIRPGQRPSSPSQRPSSPSVTRSSAPYETHNRMSQPPSCV